MARPREPYTFFADRSLGGKKVVAALRAVGETVVALDSLFKNDEADDRWLAAVGDKGWVVLTKDKNVAHRLIEIEAIHDAGVAAFILASSDLSGDDAGRAFVAALPAMKAMLAASEPPFIATLSASGRITSTLDRDGCAARVAHHRAAAVRRGAKPK